MLVEQMKNKWVDCFGRGFQMCNVQPIVSQGRRLEPWA